MSLWVDEQHLSKNRTGHRAPRRRTLHAEVTSMNERIQGRAVVIGAGVAGLLAARVLGDRYDEVTIVERDRLPGDDQARRGVPQGAHAHALLARGQHLLEARFPGLTAELIADGATVGDVLGDVRMHLSGHRLRSAPTGLTAISVSRPFLEGHLRRRVTEMHTITIRDHCDVVGVSATADRRITGVRIVPRRDGSAEELLTCDAVVDASGRQSRMPAWLAHLDIGPPEETCVDVQLGYASRHYRLDRDALDGDIAVIYGMTAERPRGGGLAVLENGTGIATLAGLGDDRPPTDPERFNEFARSLPEIHAVVEAAEPIDDPVPFRFPASTRRHYERHRHVPEGLASIGDGFCNLNPVYGQGMTLAALGADVLDRHLARYGRIRPRRFHRQLASRVRPAWQMVTAADLALPEVDGRPSPSQRMLGAYVHRLHAAAASDPTLSAAFIKVAGLTAKPATLLRPSTLGRVLHARGAE
jgi:2-polyprenyl-6-methoxyphenol hydroxylase-like FAD-dependent oxidoreductase